MWCGWRAAQGRWAVSVQRCVISVAVRGRRGLCACAPVWHAWRWFGAVVWCLVCLLHDVLLLLLCWLCVRAWACAGAMVAWYQSSACDDGPARLCVVSGVGTLADGGTQFVSDGSLWCVGSIGVVDGGRRVVGLCRCSVAS